LFSAFERASLFGLFGSPLRIELTPDGSATLWSERYRQHYHDRNGALTQARHVFLQGTRTDLHPSPRVLEIGFGVGMNFLTTLADSAARDVPLCYLAFEFDPQPVGILREIGSRHPAAPHPLWRELLTRWPVQEKKDAGEPCTQDGRELASDSLKLSHENGKISVEICLVDAVTAVFPPAWASAVYLDGFSPDVNPELWTPGFAAKLAGAMRPGAWLATYSAAGTVRRALAQAGLRVSKRPGAAGKRECLHAQLIGSAQPECT